MRTALALALTLSLHAFASEPQPLTRERVLETLHRTTSIRSADGWTTVTADWPLPGADALRLCQFTTDVRKRIAALLNTPLDGEAYTAELFVPESQPNTEPSVSLRLSPQNLVRIRLSLNALESLPPEEVTRALCHAYLHADAIAHGWNDAQSSPYPIWVSTGLARLLHIAARQNDAEQAIQRLESGTLPPLPLLFSKDTLFTPSHPDVAAQLVAWILSHSPTSAFQTLRSKRLQANAWDHDLLLSLSQSAEFLDAEDAWQRWLKQRKWVVLTPGFSHPALILRIRQTLSLPPPNNDPLALEGLPTSSDILAKIPPLAYAIPDGLTPETLLLNHDQPWAAPVAMALSGRLQRAAAGHSIPLLTMADAYNEFFHAILQHKSPSELRALLDSANQLLSTLEQQAHRP